MIADLARKGAAALVPHDALDAKDANEAKDANHVYRSRDRSRTVLGKTRRVHFIGIGGIGMSGIAELLANLGYGVAGSDERRSVTTERLERLGIKVAYGHDAANVGDADVVVVSSAVKPANAEVREAVQRQIPVIPRAEMLAELMRLRYAIAVAGSHGKTTTTSMIAFVLERSGLDPTAVIGGRVSAFGSNARLGRGEYMVAEADESDRSFLKLFPTIAVITNIDHEHLENYRGFADLQQAFVDFANRVPFYGAVIACADDPAVADVLPRLTRKVTSYGLTGSADFTATVVRPVPMGISATVERRVRAAGRAPVVETLGTLELQVPGRHNLLNALATIAVCGELGVPFDRAAAALSTFRGAERRFDVRGEVGGVLVVDDYGHHPTEIAAVLAAARDLGRRIIVAFQPHRYTRTAALMDAFGPAFAGADRIVLTDIYPAGEERIAGVTVEALAAAVRRSVAVPVDVVPSLSDVVPVLLRHARAGDVIITLGAGSIGALADQIIGSLEERS
jgi:UDP-N-acetylmuramate--alanine ligase